MDPIINKLQSMKPQMVRWEKLVKFLVVLAIISAIFWTNYANAKPE